MTNTWRLFIQLLMGFNELLKKWPQCLVSVRRYTFVLENRAVRAEILLVVPGQVPGLSRSHTAAFTPNAGHAHLQKEYRVTIQQAQGGFTLQTIFSMIYSEIALLTVSHFCVIYHLAYVLCRQRNLCIFHFSVYYFQCP